MDDWGDIAIEGPHTRALRRALRILLGLVALGLGGAGTVLVLGPESPLTGLPMRLAGALPLLALAALGLFNLLLGRRWRWPGWLLLASLPLLFAVRLLVGP